MNAKLGHLVCEESQTAGRFHVSRQSAPNYVLFRLKVDPVSSLAARPNTNEQLGEVDTVCS